ncbi:hypothetical protein C7R92_06835 [Brevibacillus porteri]|uniref:Uncharacterized protein n=1 Tax=Brevibacillus porteri TaxID=2126350 RepID=A0ABX5FTV4_9BACL|nr:hypothetical protein C7R92_06835 [Brevibacillus porteri]
MSDKEAGKQTTHNDESDTRDEGLFRSKTDQLLDLFCDKLFVISIQEKIAKRIGIIKFLSGLASIGMSFASFCVCTAYAILNK